MAPLIAQVHTKINAEVNPAQDLQSSNGFKWLISSPNIKAIEATFLERAKGVTDFIPYIRAIKATFLERAKGRRENL